MMEKRKAPRVPVSMKIEKDASQKALIFGYARDISCDGISVTSEVTSDLNEIPNIGDTLELSFKLPKSDHKINVTAKLVRVDMAEGKPPVLGLSYMRIESDSKKNIDHFVTEMQMTLFKG